MFKEYIESIEDTFFKEKIYRYCPKKKHYYELKKEITLDSKDSPIEFSADVSGAEFIKIEVSGGLYYQGDWIPGICVTDLGLY